MSATVTVKNPAEPNAHFKHGIDTGDHSYSLATNYHGTTRLALQHFVWKEVLGYNIHPDIPALSRQANVADVATGTALWLADVGRQLGPAAALTGFDLNLSQAPVADWLPANTALRQWNFFHTPPAECEATFDLVHVRFVSITFQNPGDPDIVISNVLKLLKPGGWLQWDECNTYACYLIKLNPGQPTPAMDRFCNWMAHQEQHKLTTDLSEFWSGGFTRILEQNGLEKVCQHDLGGLQSQRPDLMRFNTDQLMMSFEQAANSLYDRKDENEDTQRLFIDGAEEVSHGCAIIIPLSMWTAQKPL